MTEPSILVFDVNETLLDIDSLAPLFHRLFGDPKVLREWFAQLVLYSEAITLSGLYEDFFSLGRAVLEMLGAIHGVHVTSADIDELKALMLTMPAHPDVEEGLTLLQRTGFRMVTCTNSPPNPHGNTPLEHAGIAHFFERQISVQTVRAFKPALQVYHMVARELGAPPASCCMIAAHVWD
ncbi:MAG: haloacid dehalogenase type II, partial [Acidobacteriaceae bacterium]